MEVRLSVLFANFVERPLRPIDEDFLHTEPEWVVVEDSLKSVWWLELQSIAERRAFLCINSST